MVVLNSYKNDKTFITRLKVNPRLQVECFKIKLKPCQVPCLTRPCFKTFYFQPLKLLRLLDFTILRTDISSSRIKTESLDI